MSETGPWADLAAIGTTGGVVLIMIGAMTMDSGLLGVAVLVTGLIMVSGSFILINEHAHGNI